MALYDNKVAFVEYNRSDDNNNNDDVLMCMWFKKKDICSLGFVSV